MWVMGIRNPRSSRFSFLSPGITLKVPAFLTG
jgi:hypothetical protein